MQYCPVFLVFFFRKNSFGFLADNGIILYGEGAISVISADSLGYLQKPVSIVFKMNSRQQAAQSGGMVCICGLRAG